MKTIDLFSIVSHILISGSVGNITVHDEGTRNVTISWSEPSSGNGYYFVEWKAIGEVDVSKNEVNDSQTTIGGLEPGTEYFISVAACGSYSSSCVDTGEKSNTTARTCKFRGKLMLRLKEKMRKITWNFI